MTAVGIDFGSFSCNVSSIRGGSVDLVVSETGKRYTPTFINFGDNKREIGSIGMDKYFRQTKEMNSINCIKRFIGLKFSQLSSEEFEYLPNAKCFAGPDDSILFEVNYQGKVQQFTPEQVLGTIFTYIARKVRRVLQCGPNINAVVSIPFYFTEAQRRAVIGAAKIGGIHVYQLIPDLAALGILRGIRLNIQDDKVSEKCVMMDIGYADTSIGLLTFSKEKVVLQNFQVDRFFGSRCFDKVLFEHFHKFILEKYSLDTKSNLKATLKLWQTAEKLKIKLGQSEVAQTYLECFMNGKDVQLKITRDEFMKLCEPLLEKFRNFIKSYVKTIDLKKVGSLEIQGGGGYMPWLRDLSSQLLKKKAMTTLNAIESFTKGCALQAALRSPGYSLTRKVVLEMRNPYTLKLGWVSGGSGPYTGEERVNKTKTLASLKTILPTSFHVDFKRQEDFDLFLFYDPEMEKSGYIPKNTNMMVSKFEISGVPVNEKKMIRFTVRENESGMLEPGSAFYMTKEIVKEKVEIKEEDDKKKKPDDEQKKDGKEEEKMVDEEVKKEEKPEEEKEEPKKEEEEEEEKAGEKEKMKDEDEGEEKKSEEEPKKEGEKEEDKKEPPKKKKKKEKKYKIVEKEVDVKKHLTVKSHFTGFVVESMIKKYRDIETAFVKQDVLVEATLNAKNQVETFAYEIQDQTYEGMPLYPYCEPENVDKIQEAMQEAIDWVYGDGESVEKKTYDEKLDKLRQMVMPAKRRMWEGQNRGKAGEVLRARAKELTDTFVNSTDEKYNHIDAKERGKITEKIEEVLNWLKGEEETQKKLAGHIDPTLTVSIIREKLNELNNFATPIMNTPKPPPPKKEEEKKTKKGKKKKKKKGSSTAKKEGGEEEKEGEKMKDEDEDDDEVQEEEEKKEEKMVDEDEKEEDEGKNVEENEAMKDEDVD